MDRLAGCRLEFLGGSGGLTERDVGDLRPVDLIVAGAAPTLVAEDVAFTGNVPRPTLLAVPDLRRLRFDARSHTHNRFFAAKIPRQTSV